MKEPRYFESDMTEEEAELQRNSGIKLKPSRTRQVQERMQKSFDQQVSETNSKLEGYLKEAYELAKAFNDIMMDTRVPENIGPYERSFEKEITRKLINYATIVNEDPHEKEGMGSVSVITLLVKVLFKLRDRMNQQSYDHHLLEKRILQLEKKALEAEKTIVSSRAKLTNEQE